MENHLRKNNTAMKILQKSFLLTSPEPYQGKNITLSDYTKYINVQRDYGENKYCG
jgi:hypothetical protein